MIAALVAAAAAWGAAARADTVLRLDVASTFPSSMALVGEGGPRLAAKIERAAGDAEQGAAIKEMQAKVVQVKRWPPEILVAHEAAWKEVVAEEPAENPDFALIYASYARFRSSYAIWNYMGYLH
jgi:TRAP-type mannitol/chloroaromatic compound transport system substrate-binding protein